MPSSSMAISAAFDSETGLAARTSDPKFGLRLAKNALD
jgi:hypothetical protein